VPIPSLTVVENSKAKEVESFGLSVEQYDDVNGQPADYYGRRNDDTNNRESNFEVCPT
jgi:hypothetical protein